MRWTDTTPGTFDRDAPEVQLALIPAPDPVGTLDLFDAPNIMGVTGIIFVCAACGTPTESEPCPDHQPGAGT